MEKEVKYTKKKDPQLTFAVVVLIVMIFSAGAFSYSYFTPLNEEGLPDVDITGATLGNAIVNAGDKLTINVDSASMSFVQVDKTTPAITDKNDIPLSIVMNTTETGGILTCVYDIVYTPSEPYINSKANLLNEFEFTIKGESSNGKKITETNLGNVTQKLTLLSGHSTTLSGINKTTVEEFTFEIGYYNQDFSQNDNTDVTFGGDISIENLNCQQINE